MSVPPPPPPPPPPRRLIIEGNIGAGKSTVLEYFKHDPSSVHVLPEPVHEWKECLRLFYETPTEWALPFSLMALCAHARRRAKDAPPGTSWVVGERCCLATRHVFTQVLFNDRVLDEEGWALFKAYYEELKWEPTSRDIIVFLHVPAETCHERILERGREGENIGIEYLRSLEFQYTTMLKFAPCPVHVLDGTLAPDVLARTIFSLLN